MATRSRPSSELLAAVRRARDLADRDFARPLTLGTPQIPGCFILMWTRPPETAIEKKRAIRHVE